jgi:hypothetical protein
VFEPGSGQVPQLHDLNPSFAPPLGLFWTVQVPAEAIEFDPDRNSASVQVNNLPILDHGTIPNALSGMTPATAGSVSFRVEWSGAGDMANIRSDSPALGHFAGEFVRNSAQIEWSAQVGPYQLTSAPMSTSSSAWAEMGRERNGIFY